MYSILNINQKLFTKFYKPVIIRPMHDGELSLQIKALN